MACFVLFGVTTMTYEKIVPENTRSSNGVNALNDLLTRIAVLEEKVQELERKAHDTHTLDGAALAQIVEIVKQNIAQTLAPPKAEN
jgi:hypothetical protein